MIFFQPCCKLLYGKIIEWFIFICNFIAPKYQETFYICDNSSANGMT